MENQKDWILKHKKNKVYLRLHKDGYREYVVDVDKATRFNLKEVNRELSRCKYPENWMRLKRGQIAGEKN